MIHYQLVCGRAHEFDGWFKDSDNFERQAKSGFIACPQCADTKIARALMAPGLARKGRAPVIEHEPAATPAAESAPPAPPVPAAAGPMPDGVRAMLHRMRAEVEKNCDYVGPNLAKEARKIHQGKARSRGIYGESTEAEAEALAEDGIEIARIPWVPRADS